MCFFVNVNKGARKLYFSYLKHEETVKMWQVNIFVLNSFSLVKCHHPSIIFKSDVPKFGRGGEEGWGGGEGGVRGGGGGREKRVWRAPKQGYISRIHTSEYFFYIKVYVNHSSSSSSSSSSFVSVCFMVVCWVLLVSHQRLVFSIVRHGISNERAGY